MPVNGYDRVNRYTSSEEAAFRALVGDDMNGLIEAIQTLTDKLSSYTARLMGVQISLILLLAGVIFDIVKK